MGQGGSAPTAQQCPGQQEPGVCPVWMWPGPQRGTSKDQALWQGAVQGDYTQLLLSMLDADRSWLVYQVHVGRMDQTHSEEGWGN